MNRRNFLFGLGASPLIAGNIKIPKYNGEYYTVMDIRNGRHQLQALDLEPFFDGVYHFIPKKGTRLKYEYDLGRNNVVSGARIYGTVNEHFYIQGMYRPSKYSRGFPGMAHSVNLVGKHREAERRDAFTIDWDVESLKKYLGLPLKKSLTNLEEGGKL